MAGPRRENRAPGAPRSAERDVERLIFICFAVFRAGVVVQMVGSTVWLAFESDLPAGSAAMCFAAAAWSVLLFAHVWRRGSFADCSTWWCAADVGVGLAALVSAVLTLPAPLLVGTWHAWAYAYTAVVAPSVAAWAQPGLRSVGLAGGLAAAYVITVLPPNT
ncbi:MAG: hypothetical protein LBG11_09270, partial [Bifidobacteriaceae bacterium]|nr:hypothetical protein [Bifidobacteriaceae bacterium]